MKKLLTYTLSSFVAVLGSVGAYQSTQSVDAETASDTETQKISNAAAATCTVSTDSTLEIMYSQAESETESEDFFIGCGTIL